MLTQVCGPADKTNRLLLFQHLVLGAVQDIEICKSKFPAQLV